MDVLQGSGAPGHPTRGSPEGAQGGLSSHQSAPTLRQDPQLGQRGSRTDSGTPDQLRTLQAAHPHPEPQAPSAPAPLASAAPAGGRPPRPLTCHVRLQRLRHQAPGHPQVLGGAAPGLQPAGHAHALQHLDVVMDLKRVVEIEQVLKPGGDGRRQKSTVSRTEPMPGLGPRAPKPSPAYDPPIRGSDAPGTGPRCRLPS